MHAKVHNFMAEFSSRQSFDHVFSIWGDQLFRFKGFVNTKMDTLSSFTHPHFISEILFIIGKLMEVFFLIKSETYILPLTQSSDALKHF